LGLSENAVPNKRKQDRNIRTTFWLAKIRQNDWL